MHNGIKCNDVHLQRCFNHLILYMFIEKVKIYEINIRKEVVQDIGIETPYLSKPSHPQQLH